MTGDLQPFLISEFKSGINTYLKPWIRPQDAFEPLLNAYVSRGVINKRNGCTIFGNQLSDQNPVMGLMQYLNESTGATLLVAATTQNAYLYTAGSQTDNGTFSLLTGIGGSNSIFWMGDATGSGVVIDTFWPNLVPSSISISDGTTTITDDGAGNLSSGGIFAAGGTINYTTGVVTLNFSGTTPDTSLTLTATTSGNYFTGSIRNFFNFTNWQPTSSVTALSTSYLYMVNDVDPLTTFDGTNLARPVLYVDSAQSAHIETALDVKTYGNRLLLVRPTISGESNSANQDIYFSALFSPFNFIGDVAGNGGAISAATGDTIQSAKFLRDNLIVQFTNSVWSFQITGTTFPPFIFRRLNQTKNCSCPYAGVEYDERITNLGNTGFIACDGVNVQRYDIPIIDYYEDNIAQKYFNQCFSIRYDNLNQSWMHYPSNNLPNPDVNSIAPGSDQTLIYNFIENNWGTYSWNNYPLAPGNISIPMTCLGKFYASSGLTWQDADFSWESAQFPWFSYGTQTSAPILLGGDTTGSVYHLDNVTAYRDAQGPVLEQVIATGNGGTTYSGILKFFPIVPGSMSATDGTETFTDNGDGTLTGSAGGSGTINYTTGAWTLSFNVGVTSGVLITANYTSLGYSFDVDITTTRWNPFMTLGQKTQFAYIDIYYSVSSDNENVPIELTLNFYVDNSSTEAAVRTLTMDGPEGASYTFKRIYCNLIGEFIQMNIDPTEDADFQILGFILWCRPAGRLTPF